MSEEEKKAIEKLSSKNETTWNDTIRQIKREEITDVVITRQKYITTILNLIEKQQKEIEYYKNNNKNLGNILNKTLNEVKQNCISKDKIRERIKINEELIKLTPIMEKFFEDKYKRDKWGERNEI